MSGPLCVEMQERNSETKSCTLKGVLEFELGGGKLSSIFKLDIGEGTLVIQIELRGKNVKGY